MYEFVGRNNRKRIAPFHANVGASDFSRPRATATTFRICVLSPAQCACAYCALRPIRGEPDELAERIDLEADFFGERLQSPEVQAAFAAFFARKK
jgi:hypothetical protein